MKQGTRHRLWILGIVALTSFSFLAGTSLACFQKGTGTLIMAENCCRGQCQHVMVGDMAAKCCQHHQTKVAHALPTTPAAKLSFLTASPLPYVLLSPAALHSPEQSWMRFSRAERPPPSLSLPPDGRFGAGGSGRQPWTMPTNRAVASATASARPSTRLSTTISCSRGSIAPPNEI